MWYDFNHISISSMLIWGVESDLSSLWRTSQHGCWLSNIWWAPNCLQMYICITSFLPPGSWLALLGHRLLVFLSHVTKTGLPLCKQLGATIACHYRGEISLSEEGGGVPITSYFWRNFPLFLISFQGFFFGVKKTLSFLSSWGRVPPHIPELDLTFFVPLPFHSQPKLT